LTDQLTLAETTGEQPGGFLALLDSMNHQVVEKHSRSSLASRKAGYQDMLKNFDLARLVEMREKMSRAIDMMTAHQTHADTVLIPPWLAEKMMIEILDQTAITELLMARREMIKEAVFDHLNEVAVQKGISNPEHTPGEIEVPSLGKRFVREACGRHAPTLDEDAFREALGDRADQAFDTHVVPRQVIPKHVEHTLSPEKVLELVNKDPAVLEMLRTCLTPGNYRTPRFVVKDMKEQT
jgi:hypothetical protein